MSYTVGGWTRTRQREKPAEKCGCKVDKDGMCCQKGTCGCRVADRSCNKSCGCKAFARVCGNSARAANSSPRRGDARPPNTKRRRRAASSSAPGANPVVGVNTLGSAMCESDEIPAALCTLCGRSIPMANLSMHEAACERATQGARSASIRAEQDVEYMQAVEAVIPCNHTA